MRQDSACALARAGHRSRRRSARRCWRRPRRDASFAACSTRRRRCRTSWTTRARWHAPFIYPWTLDEPARAALRAGSVAARAARLVRGRPPRDVVGRRAHAAPAARRRQLRPRRLQPAAVRRAHLARAVARGGGGRAAPRRARSAASPATPAGSLDDLLMRASDFVLVLPAMYVALALRSVLRLVLPPFEVFVLLTGIFAVVGAPFIARGVRAIVRSEKQRDYAVAAVSLGAGHVRVLAAAPAAGRARLHRRRDRAAGAGVHRRRSDAVVRGPRLSGSDRELGHDAARRVDRSRVRRFSVAAQSRRRRCSSSCSV